MSLIDKLSTLWASSGDKTDPGTAKREDGWEVGERPPAEWFNWLANLNDTRINQLIDAVTHARGGMPPSADASNLGRRNQEDINSWTIPWYSNNYYAFTSMTNISSTAVGWDAAKGVTTIFFVDGTDGDLKAIDCWDYDSSLSAQIESKSYTPGFAVDHTSTNIPMIACDGYLYMLLQSNVNSFWYLQKYSIANWTGTPVYSTPWIASAYQWGGQISDLVEVDADRIGVVIVPASFTYVVKTINKDGTGEDTGYGAASDWTELEHFVRSDGTNIYFCAVFDGSRQLVQMDVDLTSTGYDELNADTDRRPYDMVCAGDQRTLIALGVTDAAGGSSVGIVTSDDGTVTGEYDMNDRHFSKINAFGFDGTNLYVFYIVDIDPETHSHYNVVYSSIDIAAVASYDLYYLGAPLFNSTVLHTVDVDSSLDLDFADLNKYFLTTEFDGRDMWVIYNNTVAPKVHRIPNIGSRHSPAGTRGT